MRRIHRILVAIKDPRAISTPALLKARQLARATGAHIELFHGITAPIFVDGYGVSDEGLADTERLERSKILALLETMAGRVRRTHAQVSVATEWDFPSYEAIVRRALKTKADLIVADQHAGAHTVAGLLHLTDWELLRLSPVPVLLAKTSLAYKRPVVLAALDPGHAFSKPARLDQNILIAGSAIAQALRGSLHALHAYVPFPLAADSHLLMSQKGIERLEMDVSAAAAKALDRAIGKVKIATANRHILGADPASAIARTARELKAGIVVMGAVSRSGFRSLFIGNTAEKVLDLLSCDVLVIKPRLFANRIKSGRRGIKLVTLPSGPYPM